MNNKIDYIKTRKDLFWDIPETAYADISPAVILERTLQYGDMVDVYEIMELFNSKNIKRLYTSLKSKQRTNLSDKTINFFNIYFEKHLS